MASKKKSIFPAEIVNEEERRRKHRFIERFVADLPGYIDALNVEGLPTDIKAIDEFADMGEAAYVAHVKKLFKQYLDRIGFCPTDERKRIADNFNAMFERTKDTVAWLHGYKSDGYGFTTDKDGKVIADTSTAHKVADNETATPIDADKLTAYYEQWLKISVAWADLNRYERENGLPVTNPDAKLGFITSAGGLNAYGETTPLWIATKTDAENHKDIFLKTFGQNFAK